MLQRNCRAPRLSSTSNNQNIEAWFWLATGFLNHSVRKRTPAILQNYNKLSRCFKQNKFLRWLEKDYLKWCIYIGLKLSSPTIAEAFDDSKQVHCPFGATRKVLTRKVLTRKVLMRKVLNEKSPTHYKKSYHLTKSPTPKQKVLLLNKKSYYQTKSRNY